MGLGGLLLLACWAVGTAAAARSAIKLPASITNSWQDVYDQDSPRAIVQEFLRSLTANEPASRRLDNGCDISPNIGCCMAYQELVDKVTECASVLTSALDTSHPGLSTATLESFLTSDCIKQVKPELDAFHRTDNNSNECAVIYNAVVYIDMLTLQDPVDGFCYNTYQQYFRLDPTNPLPGWIAASCTRCGWLVRSYMENLYPDLKLFVDIYHFTNYTDQELSALCAVDPASSHSCVSLAPAAVPPCSVCGRALALLDMYDVPNDVISCACVNASAGTSCLSMMTSAGINFQAGGLALTGPASTANTSCPSVGSCAAGCHSAVSGLSSDVGCCYQCALLAFADASPPVCPGASACGPPSSACSAGSFSGDVQLVVGNLAHSWAVANTAALQSAFVYAIQASVVLPPCQLTLSVAGAHGSGSAVTVSVATAIPSDTAYSVAALTTCVTIGSLNITALKQAIPGSGLTSVNTLLSVSMYTASGGGAPSPSPLLALLSLLAACAIAVARP